MSALEKFLETRKVDTRATGEIQDGYKVYETIHDELYESALAELATLRAQLAEAREIISGIADISPWSVVESDFLRQKAKAYLDKVTTV